MLIQKSFSGVVGFVLLTSFLFCTIDNAYSHESEHNKRVDRHQSVTSSVRGFSNPVHRHDNNVCCDELLSDIPRYLTFMHYQYSASQLDQIPNTFTILHDVQNNRDEDTASWWYHAKVPDRNYSRFLTVNILAHPPTGPPA